MMVSVIIPTYNRADLVVEALESVSRQTRAADEILVIDDGSTDDTRNRIETTVPSKRIRVIEQPRQGVSAARNRGIRESSGEWLAFLDSDDLWKPEKLEKQLWSLARAPHYRICYTDEEWRKNGQWKNQKKKHQKVSGHIYTRCLPLCIISPSSVVIHRTVFDRIGLFDQSLPACEDYEMWLRLTHQYPVLFLSERLIVKRAGSWTQLSNQHSLDRYRIRALNRMLADFPLSDSDREGTIDELNRKVRIYALGCRKHGKEKEARWAEAIAAEQLQSIKP